MSKGVVMVCVTRQKSCERLILKGERLAKEHGLGLCVAHVIGESDSILGIANEGEALEYLFDSASKANAELMLIRSNDRLNALIEQANKHRAASIVLGQSPQSSGVDVARILTEHVPDATVVIVPTDE